MMHNRSMRSDNTGPSYLSRRQLNARALQLALLPWLGACAQSSGRAQDQRYTSTPFTLGVASGFPEAESVVIWTRLLRDEHAGNNPLPVLWEMYADEGLKQRVAQGHISAVPERGDSVHVTVRGLKSDRNYWYRFQSGLATSRVGRTRTSPNAEAKVKSLRLALASCQHYEQGYFTAHAHIAKQDLDMVLFVGDYIYEGSNPDYRIRAHTGGVPQTLAQYRARHALYKSDPDLQAAHAAHPWVCTWDDHEVVNDYANDHDAHGNDPQRFLKRRAAAYQAYFEHMPLRLGPDAPESPNMRIHGHMAWGQLADLWTLDCRQYRSYHACVDPARGGGRVVLGCDELQDSTRSMLGAAQENWLYQGLHRSHRHWRLIAHSTLLGPSGLDTPAGRTIHTDGWDGYPMARNRMLHAIADAQVNNVVFLGGDVHMHVAGQLRWPLGQPDAPVVASELTTTSISSRGMSQNFLNRIRQSNPDMLHARSNERGYALVHVGTDGLEATLMGTAFPVQKDSLLQEQASFHLRNGQAGWVRGSL
jgi:alkaline phosphatase D